MRAPTYRCTSAARIATSFLPRAKEIVAFSGIPQAHDEGVIVGQCEPPASSGRKVLFHEAEIGDAGDLLANLIGLVDQVWTAMQVEAVGDRLVR